jgi:hypothetical protein
MTLLREAITWHQAGYTPLPTKTDGSKSPSVATWRELQRRRPTLPEVIDLFNVDHDGIGLLCGEVSGNLEMLELEGRAVADGLFNKLSQAFADHDLTHLWARINGGYAEVTPSGGVHWYYRVDGRPARNTKLARRPSTAEELAANPAAKVQVLIETRGEGGFTVIAPSAGRTHPSGKEWRVAHGAPADIPTITEDERDTIFVICSLLDQMPAVEVPQTTGSGSLTTLAGGLRPGDDFNQRATWKEILEPRGWKMVRHFGGNTYGWQRPGKRHTGLSATTGRNDADNLYIFSTATEHEEEKPHSKFSMYAALEHGGDYVAAARELRAKGYGTPTPTRHLHAVNGTAHPISGTAALAPEEPEPVLDDDFWDRRPVLSHIREFAYSRMCSPHAVLGVVLLRALHTIPPAVVLPPVIGGHGSLNLFVALVGSSGSGKGAAESAAADCITGLGEIYTATTGSGEGIAHQYAHREKGEVIQDRDAVLFTVPEVDTITAIGSRQGSTLLSQLRSAFSGEKLGYSYADASRRIPILRHSYRLAMVVGVQPEKAGPLLHDADGGTPQRFVWLQATDPKITATPPAEPKPFPVALLSWGRLPYDVSGRRIIDVPDQIIAEIREAHAARARGEGTALDGHAVFAREKVAMAFAVLDSRSSITLDDWELAGAVMRFSDITRAHIETTLRGIELRKRTAQTEMLVDRQVQAEDRVWRLKVERVADLLTKWLVELGSDVGAGTLRKRINSADRDVFDHALNLLVEQGHVVVEGEPNRRVKVVAK